MNVSRGVMIPSLPLNPQDYQRLFRVKGLRYLVDDIWMGYYKKLNVLAIVFNDEFTSYMPHDVVSQQQQEGLWLLSDADAFSRYTLEFSQFRDYAKKKCQLITSKKIVTKGDCRVFCQLLSDLFIYYSKTEFFYTDLAYQGSAENDTLQRNLKEMGTVKFAGRELSNNMFFGENSFLNLILQKLSSQFGVPVSQLLQYSVKEILALFDGRKPTAEIIASRDFAFYIQGDGGKSISVVGAEAHKALALFIVDEEQQKEIKGNTANTGKVQGRVKRIVSGYHNFDLIPKMIADMKNGDILVSETTSPELMLACQKAAAIVTDQGGLLSHAAIISRELKIPCVVGTGNATKLLKDDDLVEVDADLGVVRKL